MTFTYSSLSSSKRQIRLLEITNGISTGTPMYPSPIVQCRLRHYDFDSCPPYRALSYMWGPKSPSTLLNINGQSFEVSEGLGTFMERARHLDWLLKPPYLWIDQICINQGSETERGSQVSFMGDIYSKAIEALIWLGPAADGSSAAMTAMQKNTVPELQQNQGGLRAFFQRPYWRRLWVVQEILLSRGGKILCGKSWIAWSVLTAFIDSMLRSGRKYITLHLWPMPNTVLTLFIERGKPLQERTLRQVIDMYGRFECKYPVDSVFGLQSLLALDDRVPIDYKMGERALWESVVRRVVKSGEGRDREDLIQFARRLQVRLWVDLADGTVEKIVDEEMKSSRSCVVM